MAFHPRLEAKRLPCAEVAFEKQRAKRLPLSRELAPKVTEGEYIRALVTFVGVDLNSMVVFVEVELGSIYHLSCTFEQARDYKPPAVRGGHGCCDSSLGPPLTPLYPSTRYVTLCRVEMGFTI